MYSLSLCVLSVPCSEDGRGPLFWAYEYERYDMVKLLLDKGADAAAVDVKGNTPVSS
jgi:ankyrin repeat protein